MRLLVQTVKNAFCLVDGKVTGAIDEGYLVLVGFGLDDNEEVVEKMADKLYKLRVFEDDQGKMNLSIDDIKGDILSISQFTLYADTKKGNRPSFIEALGGDKALSLYLYFNECLKAKGLKVETGIFGAHMLITSTNIGPKTFILESR